MMDIPPSRHKVSTDCDEFVIDSEFEYIKDLGQGSYGGVIEARHKRSHEKCAIRKIAHIDIKRILTKRCLREICLLRHFRSHSNIICLYAMDIVLDTQGDFHEVYCYEELMEADLHAIIRSGQPLSDAHFQSFIYQTLCGLKYIHSANVLHRDLKPSKLLVNADCELKICDFGSARGNVSANEGFLSEYVATRYYRAPEIMLSFANYSAAIDIWSLGCILGELLGGKPLFKGRDYVDQLTQILHYLGTPKEEILQRLASPRAQEYILSLPKRPKVSFSTVFPDANPLATDLLEKMLTFDPEGRISCEDALSHHYLAAWHDSAGEPSCPRPFNSAFEGEITIEGMKQLIAKEVNEFRAEVASHRAENPTAKLEAVDSPIGEDDSSSPLSQSKAQSQGSVHRRSSLPVEIVLESRMPQPADNNSLGQYTTNSNSTHITDVESSHSLTKTAAGGLKDISRSTPLATSEFQVSVSTIAECMKGIESLQGHELHETLMQIIANESLRIQATLLNSNDAVLLSDVIQKCLVNPSGPPTNHGEILRLLQDICSTSGELPSKYWLRGISVNWRQYIARGGEATIYRGTMGDQKVVAREISKPGESDWASPAGERVVKLIKREIIVHAQLRHPNIIPLLGIYRESADEPPMMIMPFMENGSAPAFLHSARCRDSDCARILTGSALALSYLHSRSPIIIHGDVHPNNILVDVNGEAVLCDFGFSRIRYEVTRTQTNIREGGRLRYLAPELSYGPDSFRTTAASDVYSLAMTLFNLSTLRMPYEEHRNEMAAADAARNGQRPQKPNTTRFFAGSFNTLWELLVLMWKHDDSARPTAATVAQHLKGNLHRFIHASLPPSVVNGAPPLCGGSSSQTLGYR